MVRSVNTVRRKVMISTMESPDLVFSTWANSLRSLMFQATIISTGAMLASGIWEA
ncbi:hypothetical protein D3C73_1592450 [compost metagenome]